MDLGIGAVIQSNLYKPLAEGDIDQLSKIIISAKKFFSKIVGLYILFLIIFIPVYTSGISEFDALYTSSLIAILAINLIVEYLFGIVNQCVLIADQKGYVLHSLSSVLLVFIVVINSIMIMNHASIQLVRLTYSVIISIKPIMLYLYVRKKYKINYKLVLSDEPIKQKWNGVAQHVASYITTSTDTIILTIFSSLSNVSVYYVYNLVVNGIKQIVSALMNGLEALFGNMLAKGEKEYLSKKFYELEWISHTAVTFLFSCAAALIRDFVLMYTVVNNDADYDQELFGVLLSLAIAFWCIRTIYFAVVKAAGHYRQTQTSSIIEMIINLSISIVVVFKYGLVGVALGTLVAMIYRTTYLAKYINNIIPYDFRSFIKHVFIDMIVFISTVLISKMLKLNDSSLTFWLYKAFIIIFCCGMIELFINSLVYRKQMSVIIQKIRRK